MLPILQPEAAADAVMWAAHHRRREVLLAGPTVKTVLGAQLAPWVMTRIVARRAYESQMTAEDSSPQRGDNLFEPVPGDHGAHGVFDDEADSGAVRGWYLPTGAVEWGGAAIAAAIGFSVRLVKQRGR